MACDNLKKCPHCEEIMQPEDVFCTNCGKQLALQPVSIKQCPACGGDTKPDAAFCTNCGARLQEKKQSVQEESPIGKQLLDLANDFLSVREIAPGRFEFSSETGAQSLVQKIKIKYEAVAQLAPEKRQLTFWEKMVERSAGMDAGFFSEKKVQKGIEVGKKVHGHLLFGGKYGFEYGKLREVVKAIAVEQGWKFKTAIFKP